MLKFLVLEKNGIQSSGSIGGRPIGGTSPFLEKIISGSIGGTLKNDQMADFLSLTKRSRSL